jgi:hypothetical protein
MRTVSETSKIILGVGLIHALLTFFLAPIGSEHLYSWDSPQWLRATWACMFDLPLLIVFAHGRFSEGVVALLLIPVNSLLLSWVVIKPIQSVLKFRNTERRRDLVHAAVGFGICLILLGSVAAVWVPQNILRAKEACIANLRQIDFGTQTNRTERP